MYQPLHLKYRPQVLNEIIGQAHIVDTLTNAIAYQKIAPAYLFTGPKGTGKTSTARILAKSLNCQSKTEPTPEPCSNCNSCRSIATSSSLDVTELDAASHSGVDNMRELISNLQLKPIEGRYKILIVDECHALSHQSWQALLKIVEQPPVHVVFVFCTTEIDKVPETIISRCQKFDFRRVSLDEVTNYLSGVATKENINITPAAVTAIAKANKGHLRDSQARLVLQYEEILACWKTGLGRGWGKIKKYLTYDLEDTALIAQRLVPSYHYEGLIVPKTNLQQRALGGNGWKWERIYEQHYPDYKPKPDRKYKFQGGIAYSTSGLYYSVAYIDFSSMYPKTILSKGIVSCKDIDRIGLGVLQYLVDEKSSLESLGKGGDITAKDKIASTKVLANSQFGFFGTSQLPFNDMEAAALVTAYARRTLQFTIDIITSNGGIPIEVDTDGIFFTHPQPEKVHAILQSQLPKGLTIKLEFIAKAMFVPERGTKNYLLWLENSKIIRKGSWRSRSRSKFERRYPVDYLSHLIDDISEAEKYHSIVKSQILSDNFPIKDLSITRRIREGEKELLKLGKPGNLVTYYQGVTGVVSINSQEKYSRQYYLDLINQKREEILTIAVPEVLEKNKRQLSLF